MLDLDLKVDKGRGGKDVNDSDTALGRANMAVAIVLKETGYLKCCCYSPMRTA